MLPIHEVGTTAEIVALYHHSTAMKAAPSKQLDDPIPKIPLWEEPGTPPLESMYSHIWPHDMDTNYSESESDSLGSSEEWEGDSESGLDSVSSEDSDNDDMDRLPELDSGKVVTESLFQEKKKEVETLVCHYLYNKGRWAKKRSTLNLGQRWMHRDIVMDVHHYELDTMTLSLSDSKGGSDKYLACY
ncbi:hypothetical protein EDB89DRAFT_1913299 [Lactarius sanguifluus]|nr:hypothetical protein EDB89DRAFT_1913299 [Lactarius sanguifluus]